VLAEADARPTTTVGHLWLTDFRCFDELEVVLTDGLTLVHGANGQGKTSLLEAIAWAARTRSFRGVPDSALVRSTREQAVIRAEVVTGERHQLFEAEIRANGRNRIRCNKQPVIRARDLHGLLRVTVFAPDDLALVKDGPAARRAYLDELLAMLAARYDAARSDYERVLKQRNALLRGGVRDDLGRTTLDVFDEQLVQAGTELVRGRLRLTARLAGAVETAYHDLAADERPVAAVYEAEWSDEPLPDGNGDDGSAEIAACLRRALEARRLREIERGMTLVGPHRDEWRLSIGDLDARTQASQGEQRTLALALRLAGHGVVKELSGTAPVLLLDDVFSELDAERSTALVRNLPAGQTLLTTAGAIPPGVAPVRRLRIHDRRIEVEREP
jgi:DNA replication and repair protein RecF